MGSNGDFYFPAAPMCIGAFSRFRQRHQQRYGQQDQGYALITVLALQLR
jgi:hypothetical protein